MSKDVHGNVGPGQWGTFIDTDIGHWGTFTDTDKVTGEWAHSQTQWSGARSQTQTHASGAH